MANTAVIYTRLSAQRDGDTQTLDNQAEVCGRLAAHKELEVLETFAEGSGVSAFKKGQDRPELARLQKFVRANPGTTVLAWEISRLTRRLVDLSGWIELMDNYGLRIVTPQLDTADPSGRMILTIMAANAEQESLEKSVRVSDGKRIQRFNNKYMGGTAPTGYRYVDDDSGALEIDPESAQVVQQAVSLFLDDRLSMRATALALNADGHLGRTGKPWTSGTIKNVFTTPAIAGLMEKADGTYNTIMGLEESGGVIDAARWREVMARIDKRAGRANGASKARRPPSRLLSAGILTCGTCGGRMAPDSQPPTKAQIEAHAGPTEPERIPTYRCANRLKRGAGGCSKGAYIGAMPVEEQVVLSLLHRLDFAMADADYEGDSTDFERIASNFKKLTDPADDRRRAELESAIGDALLRAEHAFDLYLGGKMLQEVFERNSQKATQDIETMRAELAALPEAGGSSQLPVIPDAWLAQLADGEIEVGDLPAAFVTACGSLEVARDVVGSVFDSIAVGPNVRGQHPADRLIFTYR